MSICPPIRHGALMKLGADGVLRLVEPYRWNPSLVGAGLVRLRRAATYGHGSYAGACAQDELDRRAPRTASWCSDPKVGWTPIMADARIDP